MKEREKETEEEKQRKREGETDRREREKQRMKERDDFADADVYNKTLIAHARSNKPACAYDTLWPWCGWTMPRSGVNSTSELPRPPDDLTISGSKPSNVITVLWIERRLVAALQSRLITAATEKSGQSVLCKHETLNSETQCQDNRVHFLLSSLNVCWQPFYVGDNLSWDGCNHCGAIWANAWVAGGGSSVESPRRRGLRGMRGFHGGACSFHGGAKRLKQSREVL